MGALSSGGASTSRKAQVCAGELVLAVAWELGLGHGLGLWLLSTWACVMGLLELPHIMAAGF